MESQQNRALKPTLLQQQIQEDRGSPARRILWWKFRTWGIPLQGKGAGTDYGLFLGGMCLVAMHLRHHTNTSSRFLLLQRNCTFQPGEPHSWNSEFNGRAQPLGLGLRKEQSPGNSGKFGKSRPALHPPLMILATLQRRRRIRSPTASNSCSRKMRTMSRMKDTMTTIPSSTSNLWWKNSRR